MSETKKNTLDHVADGIGSGIEGIFYLVGRASPVVSDVAEAIAKTRVGQHTVPHAHVGWTKGWHATMESRAKRQRREMRSRFGDGVQAVKKTAAELVDMVQEDINNLRGEGPDIKPVPG